MNQASMFHPGDTVGLMIAALLILICFALITAFMVLALVESYVVISAGVLMMGFAGSRWTKEYAFKVMTYAVSVGAKLFILQLLIGVGETMIDGWVTADQATVSENLCDGRSCDHPSDDHEDGPGHGPGAGQRRVLQYSLWSDRGCRHPVSAASRARRSELAPLCTGLLPLRASSLDRRPQVERVQNRNSAGLPRTPAPP